jgi:hypothetical protein
MFRPVEFPLLVSVKIEAGNHTVSRDDPDELSVRHRRRRRHVLLHLDVVSLIVLLAPDLFAGGARKAEQQNFLSAWPVHRQSAACSRTRTLATRRRDGRRIGLRLRFLRGRIQENPIAPDHRRRSAPRRHLLLPFDILFRRPRFREVASRGRGAVTLGSPPARPIAGKRSDRHRPK